MTRQHEQLTHTLICDITNGSLPPRSRLPKDSVLAAQFGVSRSVAWESLRALEERGLIEIKHARGARVTTPNRWHSFEPVIRTALLTNPDRRARTLREFRECQHILLTHAARLAATRATPDDLQRLREAFTDLCDTAVAAPKNAADETRFANAEVSFYEEIGEATGNRVVRGLISTVSRATRRLDEEGASTDWKAQAVAEHERILRAIHNRDPDTAFDAMKARLASVEAAA